MKKFIIIMAAWAMVTACGSCQKDKCQGSLILVNTQDESVNYKVTDTENPDPKHTYQGNIMSQKSAVLHRIEAPTDYVCECSCEDNNVQYVHLSCVETKTVKF